ncbi:MAG: hypothetical protein H6510_10195 [Acidobacteria bacterium]|nr:hypothetical protein [Acidobacteriota bacterium]MCB9398179.1 hypothetical protein [Acidobacteriota bacterium]
MDKQYWIQMLNAYADNELSPADRLAVESYLNQNPECQKELDDLTALKKRLGAHRQAVVCPDQVLARIQTRFGNRKKSRLRIGWLGFYGAVAAAIFLAFWLPSFLEPDYSLISAQKEGTLFCYGCEVAARVGLEKGKLCKGGHQLGLLEENGRLWEFASDEKGLRYQKDLSLYKQYVKVDGQFIKKEGLVIIDNITPTEGKLANLDAAILPLHASRPKRI